VPVSQRWLFVTRSHRRCALIAMRRVQLRSARSGRRWIAAVGRVRQGREISADFVNVRAISTTPNRSSA
jgi:hypothetical protein